MPDSNQESESPIGIGSITSKGASTCLLACSVARTTSILEHSVQSHTHALIGNRLQRRNPLIIASYRELQRCLTCAKYWKPIGLGALRRVRGYSAYVSVRYTKALVYNLKMNVLYRYTRPILYHFHSKQRVGEDILIRVSLRVRDKLARTLVHHTCVEWVGIARTTRTCASFEQLQSLYPAVFLFRGYCKLGSKAPTFPTQSRREAPCN